MNHIHLVVDSPRPWAKYRTECLCLNGSAHADTARNAARVDCPRCLAILAAEKGGMTRADARNKVINGETA